MKCYQAWQGEMFLSINARKAAPNSPNVNWLAEPALFIRKPVDRMEAIEKWLRA
jgi:hypothetical protein